METSWVLGKPYGQEGWKVSLFTIGFFYTGILVVLRLRHTHRALPDALFLLYLSLPPTIMLIVS